MINILTTLLFIFSPSKTASKGPARLDKKRENTSNFNSVCNKACPYVITACLIILVVLLSCILVRYGHAITGTEANNWYYHMNV